MTKFKFAALAAALLLQSLASAANAPSRAAVPGNSGSVSLNSERHGLARADESGDYFPLPDINDAHGTDCDPEDDCPRPTARR
jgi:hypothetical protein